MDHYEDILNLPHHQSEIHAHMPLRDRAAQFAPFAALSGYEDAIQEATRAINEDAAERPVENTEL